MTSPPPSIPFFSQRISALPPFDDDEIEDPNLLSNAAAELFRMRRARDRHVPTCVVGEPGWDILLALYVEGPDGIPISSACFASGSPSSTALRWIAALAKLDIVRREPHHRDGRVTLVRLTGEGRLMVERSLKAMLRAARS